MANKNIPLKDKQIVKQRLAEGKSTSEAIKGTAIKSKQTAATIAKKDLDAIGQLRENYLKLIEKNNIDDKERAKLWAEMARGTKLFGADAIEIPDWKNRFEALKYIDRLAGVAPLEEAAQPEIKLIIQNYVTGKTKVVHPRPVDRRSPN